MQDKRKAARAGAAIHKRIKAQKGKTMICEIEEIGKNKEQPWQ